MRQSASVTSQLSVIVQVDGVCAGAMFPWRPGNGLWREFKLRETLECHSRVAIKSL